MPDETPETPETEVTTSAAIDQPAVDADASASSPSAEEVVTTSTEEVQVGGGGFNSPFTPAPSAMSMVDRLTALEARVKALEER